MKQNVSYALIIIVMNIPELLLPNPIKIQFTINILILLFLVAKCVKLNCLHKLLKEAWAWYVSQRKYGWKGLFVISTTTRMDSALRGEKVVWQRMKYFTRFLSQERHAYFKFHKTISAVLLSAKRRKDDK